MSRNPCRPRSNLPAGATALAGRAPKPNIKGAMSTIPKCAPPPKRQDKFNIRKPRENTTMAKRVEKARLFREECERKERERREQETCRRPQRTAAPTGGDARMGRERVPRPAAAGPAPRSRPTSAKSATGAPQACSTKAPPLSTQRPAARSAGPPQAKRASSAPAPKAPARKSAAPPPARREPEPPAPAPPVPERTRNLAESMNADIVQAEPLQPGMVDNIIIPPGAINSEKTTIVSIPQPESPPQSAVHHSTIAAGSGAGCASNAASRSMQVISEALEEQEANESAVINSKLQDLQNARRDFVLSVANVGNNSINLGDEDLGNIMDITPPEMMMSSDLCSPIASGRLLDFSDDDPCADYAGGQHQPMVASAREYMRTRQSYQQDEDNLLDPEYLEGCALAGPDDCQGQLPTCGPSDYYTVIPRRREQYQYPSCQVDELERFFDLENYPPCPRPTPRPTCPPPGREHINPDLWELDDPWCHAPDEPDLIDWGDYC